MSDDAQNIQNAINGEIVPQDQIIELTITSQSSGD